MRRAGEKLVAWLNGLPEVQAIVAAEFGGKPIREQNLSEWKQARLSRLGGAAGGEGVVERLARMRPNGMPRARAAHETLSRWVAARYAVATRRVCETGGPEGWRLLREMCGDIVELRKGDHSAERLQIERERLKLEQEKSEKQRKIATGEF